MRKELYLVNSFKYLKLLLEKSVFKVKPLDASVLGDLFIKVLNQIIIDITELGILFDFIWIVSVVFRKFSTFLTAVLNQRFVFRVVNSKLDDSLAQFGELDSLFEETYPSLFEGNSPDPFVLDLTYFNFFTSHSL